MRGETPIETVEIECQSCGTTERITRHTSGRKRVFCRKCIKDRKRRYDREQWSQAARLRREAQAKKGVF